MPPEVVRILLVEDSASDAALCKRQLQQAEIDCECTTVDSRDSFAQALDDFRPQLILSDFTLPGFSGLHALELTRAKWPELPFIFVSGTIGEDRAVEAMRMGATDYVMKNKLQRLAPVVRRALEEAEQRSSRRQAEHELEIAQDRLNAIIASLTDVV